MDFIEIKKNSNQVSADIKALLNVNCAINKRFDELRKLDTVSLRTKEIDNKTNNSFHKDWHKTNNLSYYMNKLKINVVHKIVVSDFAENDILDTLICLIIIFNLQRNKK